MHELTCSHKVTWEDRPMSILSWKKGRHRQIQYLDYGQQLLSGRAQMQTQRAGFQSPHPNHFTLCLMVDSSCALTQAGKLKCDTSVWPVHHLYVFSALGACYKRLAEGACRGNRMNFDFIPGVTPHFPRYFGQISQLLWSLFFLICIVGTIVMTVLVVNLQWELRKNTFTVRRLASLVFFFFVIRDKNLK